MKFHPYQKVWDIKQHLHQNENIMQTDGQEPHEMMPNITNHQGKANETTVRYYFKPTRMVTQKDRQ